MRTVSNPKFAQAAERKIQPCPILIRQSLPMTVQRFHDARVGDDGDARQGQRFGETDDARAQLGDGLPAGWREMEHVGRPGVERNAADIRPRPAFPLAEADFAEARIDARHDAARLVRCICQRFGQNAGAFERAAKNRRIERNARTQATGDGPRIFAVDIELG